LVILDPIIYELVTPAQDFSSIEAAIRTARNRPRVRWLALVGILAGVASAFCLRPRDNTPGNNAPQPPA